MENENINNNINIDKDNFLFARFILGLKGIPFNTEALLVNNNEDNTLDILYIVDNIIKLIKLPKNSLNNISFSPEINIQKTFDKEESYEIKSKLLSAVTIGKTPLSQLVSSEMYNLIIANAFSNYDKLTFNAYYRINIDSLIENQEVKFLFSVNNYPEGFINFIKK